MPQLFIIIGNGDTSWSYILIKKPTTYKSRTNFLSNLIGPILMMAITHHMENGISEVGTSSWVIDNPIKNIPKDEFINIMTSINQTIRKNIHLLKIIVLFLQEKHLWKFILIL